MRFPRLPSQADLHPRSMQTCFLGDMLICLCAQPFPGIIYIFKNNNLTCHLIFLLLSFGNGLKIKSHPNGGATLKKNKKCSSPCRSFFLLLIFITFVKLHRTILVSSLDCLDFKLQFLLCLSVHWGKINPTLTGFTLKPTAVSQKEKIVRKTSSRQTADVKRTVNVKTQSFSPNPVTVLETCRLRVTHQT